MAKVIARAYITIANVNDGGKGDTGDNALSLIVTPNTFAFQTNNKGEIENLAQNKGKVRMYLGQVEVQPTDIQVAPHNCYARIVGDNTLYFDGVSPNQWSGKVEITATYKGQTRTATVEFMVSAQKWNEAKFTANDKQFQSIIAQNKADKQGLEQKISTIEQTATDIKIEVKKQTFGGVNLLKGASLRPLNLLLLARAQYVKIVNYQSVAHLDNPYIAIVRHGAPTNEWNGCKFPVVKAIGGRTYTLSMYTRIYGSEQPYIEVKRSRSKDMSAPKNSYPNIPSTYGVWKQYTYTFDMEEGYNYLQIFIGYTRDGEAYLSEVQLEEGTKATTWKDPDVVESMEAAGVYIDGKDMSINARSNHFNFIDQEGRIVASVDKEGVVDGLKFRTRNLGGGYIDLTGSLMTVFGAVTKNIEFGIDNKGQAVLKFYDNAGNNTLNLSPDGLKAENIQTAKFSPIYVAYIGGLQILNYDAENSIFNPYFIDTKPPGTSVYQYTSAKINGIYTAHGSWSQATVAANDGKYFRTNSPDRFNSFAHGVYAVCLPQVKLMGSGIDEKGRMTDFQKEYSIITLYAFDHGKLETHTRVRVRTL